MASITSARRTESGRVIYVSPLVRYLVVSVAFAGITHLLAAITGLLSGDILYSLQLLAWSIGYLAFSIIWLMYTRPSRSMRKEEAFVLVALAWVLTPFFSAVPVSVVLHIPLVDSWFESISGYTTTGLSVFTGGVDPFFHRYVPSVEETPPSILWWRAYCQWLGGFGIVVMFFVFARLGGLPAHLVGLAEGRYERLEPSIAKSLRALMLTYLFFTLVDIALIYFAGAPLPNAVYDAMTALSTGGFETHSASIAFYHSFKIELAVIAGMIFGACNFADLYALLTGKKRKFSGETTSLLLIIAITTLLSAPLLLRLGMNWTTNNPFREALFDVVSAVTTTGFSISNLGKAPELWKLILIILMLIGGSVLSTTGGIKQYRLIVFFKNMWWNIKETLQGDVIVRRRIGGYTIDYSEIAAVFAVIAFYIVGETLGTILMVVFNPQYHVIDAAFEVASALATTGLSVGITSASAPLSAKIILMVLMTLGRLEVVGFFYALESARRIMALRRRRSELLSYQ